MARFTIVLCDIKPCKMPAEREFEVNGEKICVCGEACFVKFWSREYGGWKAAPYQMRTFQELPSEFQTRPDGQSIDILRSDLHLLRSDSEQSKKYV